MVNSLSRAFSYVLRVLFPLIKMGVFLTAATVSAVFTTKGKIAFCASGYTKAELSEQTHFQALRKISLFLFSAYQFLRISPPGLGFVAAAVRAEEEQTPELIPGGEK